MKKITLIVILITFYSIAKCQLDQGTWLAGGSATFNKYREYYTTPTFTLINKYTEFTLYPAVGYFFAEKFAGGIRGGVTYFKEHNIAATGGVSGGSTQSIQYSAGPFARYYFLNPDKVYNILADVCYQFGSNRYLGALHDQGKLNTFSILAGPEFYFNTAVGIEVLLGYFEKTKSKNSPLNGFNSDSKGLEASISFQFHLLNN